MANYMLEETDAGNNPVKTSGKAATLNGGNALTLDEVIAGGNKNLSEYETGMQNAISSNEKAMNNALDQVGVDEKGNVKDGSATDKLIDVQNKNTEFAIDTIEQKQEQAEQDYTKEQAGAYADYQKQIDPYGVQAEQVAASGLSNSGYAESLKTQAYVAYQNRVAVARESFNRIVQDFNNQITQARLQNNATIAQIISDAMAQRLQIMMEFSVRGNELYTQMVQGGASIKQQNISNYMSVYNQLMQEKQFDAQMAFQREQFEYQKAKAASSGSSGGSGSIQKSSGGSSSSSSGKKTISKSEAATIDAALTGKKTPAKSEPTVDMISVLKLGYGPISAKTLDRLIKQGKVEEYTEGGKLKYRKVFKR